MIPVSLFGLKLGNGSYVGALKLIHEAKADMYGRPELLAWDEPFLYYTPTVYQPKFSIGQIALDLSKSKEAQSSLSAVNLERSIKFFAIASLLLTLILLTKLAGKGFSLKGLELVTRNLFEFNFSLSRSFSWVGFVVVFYHIYFMIFKAIISSNIKTQKVIVNASLIVDSLEDLGKTLILGALVWVLSRSIGFFLKQVKTQNTVCWLLDETKLEIAKKSPKGSFLNRIYTKNTYNWMTGNYSTCYYLKGPNLKMFAVMDKIVFFLTPTTMGKLLNSIESIVLSQYVQTILES